VSAKTHPRHTELSIVNLSTSFATTALVFCLMLPTQSAKANLLDSFLASVLLGTLGAARAL